MIVKVDKITVAGCQLDTAIELILSDKDVVSAVVLVHSAWSVAKDLLKIRKIESSRTWMPEFFPDSSEREVWNQLDLVWNFCKHAKDDPDNHIKFKADYIEVALFLALYDFSQLSVKSKAMEIYEVWFIAKNEKVFVQHEVFSQASKVFPELSKNTIYVQKKIGLEAVLSADNFYEKIVSKTGLSG